MCLLTHAVVSSVDLHVLGGAHAGVVAQGVVARPRPADPDMSSTLVDICTEAHVVEGSRSKTAGTAVTYPYRVSEE